ncbi:glycosyltransferase family 69 protein [Aspergillus lucknowensis]|uniref:Cryptococcal mannosyltransferase 1-domain-containing protein n=1 Tax=Aspergillus lucknowensis TaxID=176173 RepID=A0ABR4M5X4_9EURO
MSTPLSSNNSPTGRLSGESQEIYGLYKGDLGLLISAVSAPPLRRRLLHRLFYYLLTLLSTIAVLVAFTATFYPSYTHLPPHYTSLRNQVLNSNQTGRGNPRNEKIFIAASLYDPAGELARGSWASSLLQLITLLGEDNVFLSIYENDSGDEGRRALQDLDARVPCNKSIIYESLDLEGLPKIVTPDGMQRVKRITYLAEARNRALHPLDRATTGRFDKLLYLNDVAFDPVDALQLLFSTNAAPYRAACAVDFINPFKFYDTYATRDAAGYSMGLPFFPWFSDAGSGQSRRAVLAGKDAVPVRSCWGGMVAFDARLFQNNTEIAAPPRGVAAGGSIQPPARFRALNDTDLFWDASECCLIHADIQASPRTETETDREKETGIYLNPFVRVAYDTRTLSWLSTTRRLEKLYTIIHNILNHLVGLPWFNPRREEIPGQQYQDTVFVPEAGLEGAGFFRTVQRVGRHDGFCGRPGLQVVASREGEGQEVGRKGWETLPMPARDVLSWGL